MDENVQGIPRSLSAVCEEAVAAYREHGRNIQVPAIRKVLESVIRQKNEHVAVLRPFDTLCSAEVQRISFVSSADPEDVLRSLVVHEKAFYTSLDTVVASLQDKEARQTVKAVADASRKFSSWAQDHLDLLAMF